VSAARILLIEDEPALARGLSDTLRARGFDVAVAIDGERGLESALTGQADLILLDVMLPKINGYEVCRAIREQGIDTPILMLTAKGQEQDVILGLNLGADDYITKPFRVGELIARAQAFLRRRDAAPVAVRFGDCEINLRARTVRRGGAEIDLTSKEFALLAYFASRPGCALSRDTILNAVWGVSVFVSPRSIDRCVTTLRAKVEPDPHRPVFIQTIRDIGYRFEPNGSS
jgi:two-component system, OmpR family, alkaline phosphatase synthesis response regulator PhoP